MKKSNHFSLEKISNNSYYFTIRERGNGKRYHEKLIKEQTIKDLERVIKEFERVGLKDLAEMKKEELKKLKEGDKNEN